MNKRTKNNSYTPTPWTHEGRGAVYQHGKGDIITIFNNPTDAIRAVACVNACKGVSNEWLQSNGVQARIDEIAELKRIIAQDMDRINELFEALQGVTAALTRVLDKHDPDSIEYEWVGNAHEVITTFKNEKP